MFLRDNDVGNILGFSFWDNSSRFLQFFVPCTDNPSSKESSLLGVFVTEDFSDRRYCGLRHPCVGWTGLVPWFDAIIPDVMLLCWPRRINTEFTDTLWHHWREAPSGLKEIFSETIMIMSRQIDPQPHPPLAVSAFQFLLPVFPPKSNILCPLFSLSFLERIVSL